MNNITLIDEVIEVLCKAVRTQEKNGAYESVIELTNALAALITAKASLNMYSRMYMRGSNNYGKGTTKKNYRESCRICGTNVKR